MKNKLKGEFANFVARGRKVKVSTSVLGEGGLTVLDEIIARNTTVKKTNLRHARPVRRVMGGVEKNVVAMREYCTVVERWTHPKGGEEPSPFVLEAYGALEQALGGFSKFFDAMETLDELGFSPPRISYTAATKVGDTVSVLERFRERYADLLDPSLMDDLYVLRRYPGKGGGLVVTAKNGMRLKVAVCHVVKFS